ncbi:hypothetical protein ABT052_29220 [Streptomyces sp. NPDC002766]|uniref:hypothetical protein n=1 Tax=Streptomyces sp. NPDC002766 TaxID=3154429 RepID=UPI00331CAE11
MFSSYPVIVGPPDNEGGRLVRIRGAAAGRAFGLWDMIVFLHRAGLAGFADEDEIAASERIEWLGGGPEVWDPPRGKT